MAPTSDWLWLDDFRPPPANVGWVWVKDFDEAIAWFKANELPEVVSLDHDLDISHYPNFQGEPNPDEKTGADLARWMIANDFRPPRVIIHSMNPEGVKNMLVTFLSDDYRFLRDAQVPNASQNSPVLDRRI